MNECPRCGQNLAELNLESPPTECPNCGTALVQPVKKWETGKDLIVQYFTDVWMVITHPTLFFRQVHLKGGLTSPLCFALVTHWIGSALNLIWRLSFGSSTLHWIQNLFQNNEDLSYVTRSTYEPYWIKIKELVLEWVMGAGAVILDPFFTLFSILFTSAFVYAAARIFVTPGKDEHPNEINYESAVRIVSYGLTPSIFGAIPIFGGFLSSIYVLIVTIIGAKEVYRVPTSRAFVIALFPKLLFFGIILIGLVILIFTFVRILTLAT